jgi:hypothetical protein
MVCTPLRILHLGFGIPPQAAGHSFSKQTCAMNTIFAESARRLFLGAQGLLADPIRKTTSATLAKLIEQMGFVQLDSINYRTQENETTKKRRTRRAGPEQKPIKISCQGSRHRGLL